MTRPMTIFLVAGEESGDQLGAKLMRALKERQGEKGIAFAGVGGRAMEAEGLQSLFPLSDIAIMGLVAVVARLPGLVRRVHQVVDAAVAARPDALVIIDSPEFTHAVAKRVRRRRRELPVVDYVSPSVWAWRPGRARRMRGYVDHVLALKPFEPAAHARLGGPACTYVGHPLAERLPELRPAQGERPELDREPLTCLILPGSRHSEVSRLMDPFGAAVARLAQVTPRRLEFVLPVVPHVEEEVRARLESWPVQPVVVTGEGAKYAAFRRAHLALAASGTVTLELALAGVPMVVAYRVSRIEEQLRFLIKVNSIVLANLIVGENVVPELIQRDCTPDRITGALLPLLENGPERQRQLAGFARLDAIMATGGRAPSDLAADLVLAEIARAASRRRNSGMPAA